MQIFVHACKEIWVVIEDNSYCLRNLEMSFGIAMRRGEIMRTFDSRNVGLTNCANTIYKYPWIYSAYHWRLSIGGVNPAHRLC